MSKQSSKEALDLSKLKIRSIFDRQSKVNTQDMSHRYEKGMKVADFFKCFPAQLCAKELKDLTSSIWRAKEAGKLVLMGIGGHVIKVGLAPLLVQWMEKGLIDGMLVNGSVIIHDTEIAIMGRTSEEVQSELDAGMFGMGLETPNFINEALTNAKEEHMGFGECVGKRIVDERLTFMHLSLTANAYRLNVPVFVAIAIGTDIIHMHPSFDPQISAKKSYEDFLQFARLVYNLENGVYINTGSAVVLPEVFLKAVAISRNLGASLRSITTANLDFIDQYRPRLNVVQRPTSLGGKGITIRGAHEIILPLLTAMVFEGL